MGWPKGKPRPKPTKTKAVMPRYHFKPCSACGEEKALTEYGYRYWLKGWKKLRAADPQKYRDRCKECERIKNGREIDPNFPFDRGKRGRPRMGPVLTPEEERKKRAEYKQRTRTRTRAAALRYLAQKGCQHCGCRDPRVLEFDHLEPEEKKMTISMLISQGYSWASTQMRAEVRKCRVLCANCHRLHTVVQQGYYAHDDVRSELEKLLKQYGIDP